MTAIDTPTKLRELADELEALMHSLFALAVDEVWEAPTESPTRSLARAVAHWVIAIRRLADTGARAWAVMDARFPPEEGEEPKVAPDSPEGAGEMVAELDLMVAYIAGDQVLDHFAYAELLRRDQVPPWTPGRWVPPMWPKLMDVLDEGPLDRMSSAARYLDVTLAVARDVLVAHRDPLAVALPMYSSSGQVALHRPIIDADRKAAAEGAPPGNQSLAGASVAGVGLPSAPSNSRRGSCHPRPPDP